MHKGNQRTTKEIFEGQVSNIEILLNDIQKEFDEFKKSGKPSTYNIIKARETLTGLRRAKRFLKD